MTIWHFESSRLFYDQIEYSPLSSSPWFHQCSLAVFSISSPTYAASAYPSYPRSRAIFGVFHAAYHVSVFLSVFVPSPADHVCAYRPDDVCPPGPWAYPDRPAGLRCWGLEGNLSIIILSSKFSWTLPGIGPEIRAAKLYLL
jgi:hypothetical protein